MSEPVVELHKEKENIIKKDNKHEKEDNNKRKHSLRKEDDKRRKEDKDKRKHSLRRKDGRHNGNKKHSVTSRRHSDK